MGCDYWIVAKQYNCGRFSMRFYVVVAVLKNVHSLLWNLYIQKLTVPGQQTITIEQKQNPKEMKKLKQNN